MTGSSAARWRLLDTGLRPAVQNLALNRAILEAHDEGLAPDTLRFLRFTPSALVGFHQSVPHEIDTELCQAQGIAIQRRITGGGAIYFDESQLGWELYLPRQVFAGAEMEAISRRLCEVAASGIRRLGVDARYRPRNDIEVDGRKVSGTGGVLCGRSLMFQGTLLIALDVERMLRVLRIAPEKLSDKAVQSARQRVTDLQELLGAAPPLEEIQRHLSDAFAEGFGVELVPGDLCGPEQERYVEALAEMDTREWVTQCDRPLADTAMREAVYRCSGGLLRVALELNGARDVIRQVWLNGDFFVDPPRVIPDLEAVLKDTAVGDLEANVERFFRARPAQMLYLDPADFVAALRNALQATE